MVDLKTVHYDHNITEIGVVADTHIPARGSHLPSKVFQFFDGVQLILHAGDLVEDTVLEEFRALAPVEAVAGNMDQGLLRKRLGRTKLIKIGNLSIGLLHGDIEGRRIDPDQVGALFKPENPLAIVFGHLHEPISEMHNGVLFFNPGSLIDPRRSSKPSCGRLLISGSEISGEILYID